MIEHGETERSVVRSGLVAGLLCVLDEVDAAFELFELGVVCLHDGPP
jgi:hypothetical protein